MATIFNIQNLSKTYQSAGRTLTVPENISFSVEAGSRMANVGPSGRGYLFPFLLLCNGALMQIVTAQARF